MELKEEVTSILRKHPLYLMLIHLSPFGITGVEAFKQFPEMELYEIGSQENYSIRRESGMIAYTRSKDFVSIDLSDLLIEGERPPVGVSSNYAINEVVAKEADGRIQVAGCLKEQIDLVLGNRGTNYAGKKFLGFVKEIKRGIEVCKSLPLPPEFNF